MNGDSASAHHSSLKLLLLQRLASFAYAVDAERGVACL